MISVRISVAATLLAALALAPVAVEGAGLTVRNAHAMGRDPRTGRALLFGGADDRAVRDDAYLLGRRGWQALKGPGPSARTFPAAAFDAARRRLVLFGGNRVLFGAGNETDSFLGDTWEWDGKLWWGSTSAGPAPRAEAAMAYDAGRRVVMLFGGYAGTGEARRRFGDTWEWDGVRWRLASEQGPSPRNGAAMAYDMGRRRMVLFGGSGGPLGDTWEWDGERWSKVGEPVEGRFNAAMAYDEARRVVVRFGGWDGKRRVGDTWEYDGGAWRRVASSGPPARNHASMAFDARRRRLVLFGGHDGDSVFGDTWEWDGRRWRRVGYHQPLRRLDNGH